MVCETGLLGEIRHTNKVYKSGETSQWRVCYQRGLPRLIYFEGVSISNILEPLLLN